MNDSVAFDCGPNRVDDDLDVDVPSVTARALSPRISKGREDLRQRS